MWTIYPSKVELDAALMAEVSKMKFEEAEKARIEAEKIRIEAERIEAIRLEKEKIEKEKIKNVLLDKFR